MHTELSKAIILLFEGPSMACEPQQMLSNFFFFFFVERMKESLWKKRVLGTYSKEIQDLGKVDNLIEGPEKISLLEKQQNMPIIRTLEKREREWEK